MPLALTRKRLALFGGPSGARPVLGSLLLDYDERELDGGTIVDVDAQFVLWVQNSGSGGVGTFDVVFSGGVTGTITVDCDDDSANDGATDPSWLIDKLDAIGAGDAGVALVGDTGSATLWSIDFAPVCPGERVTVDTSDATTQGSVSIAPAIPIVPGQNGSPGAVKTAGGQFLTVWPNQAGGADAILDDYNGDEGPQNGPLVGEADGHTTLTWLYAGGSSAADSRLRAPIALPDEYTLYYLWIPGEDMPGELTETCPVTIDPFTNAETGQDFYHDIYITKPTLDPDTEDDEGSYINALYNTSNDRPRENYWLWPEGADPLAVPVLVMLTSIPADELGEARSIIHMDGYVPFQVERFNSDAPATGYSLGADAPAPLGVLLGNYEGGGYCAAGRYPRFLCYNRRHGEAEHAVVAAMLNAQVPLALNEWVDPVWPWPEVDEPGVLPADFGPDDLDTVGWVERMDAEEGVTLDGDAVEEWVGLEGTTFVPQNGIDETLFDRSATTPSGHAALSCVWDGTNRSSMYTEPDPTTNWQVGTGTFFAVVRLNRPGTENVGQLVGADGSDPSIGFEAGNGLLRIGGQGFDFTPAHWTVISWRFDEDAGGKVDTGILTTNHNPTVGDARGYKTHNGNVRIGSDWTPDSVADWDLAWCAWHDDRLADADVAKIKAALVEKYELTWPDTDYKTGELPVDFDSGDLFDGDIWLDAWDSENVPPAMVPMDDDWEWVGLNGFKLSTVASGQNPANLALLAGVTPSGRDAFYFPGLSDLANLTSRDGGPVVATWWGQSGTAYMVVRVTDAVAATIYDLFGTGTPDSAGIRYVTDGSTADVLANPPTSDDEYGYLRDALDLADAWMVVALAFDKENNELIVRVNATSVRRFALSNAHPNNTDDPSEVIIGDVGGNLRIGASAEMEVAFLGLRAGRDAEADIDLIVAALGDLHGIDVT